jgi:predicted small secreted protein
MSGLSMKKVILTLGLGAAFVLAGCNQPQGSGSDTYSTGTGSTNAAGSRGSSSLSTNTPSISSTNQSPKSTP